MKKSAIAICSLVCSVMLTACGASSGNHPDITFPASTSAATSPAVTPETPTSPATPSSAQAPRGRDYVDPHGKYTITIGRTWKTSKGPGDSKYWSISRPDHGLTPTLSIVTEDLSTSRGISPPLYMKLSIKSLQKAGYTIIKHGYIHGINTPALGAIEYTGAADEQGPAAHQLLIFDMNDKVAVLVVMVSSMQSFQKYRAAAQPYMRTVKAGPKSV